MYKVYFMCYLGDQDRSWASFVRCLTCGKILSACYARKNVDMTFGVPKIWRETKKTTLMIAISLSKPLQFVQQQVNELLRLHKFAMSNALNRALWNFTCAQDKQSSSCADEGFSGKPNHLERRNKPIPFYPQAVNYFCKNFYLTKGKSEFLASRLRRDLPVKWV